MISEIHVVPGHCGRGVGDALLARAESRARVGECRCIALHTLATNPARRLYERHGYRAVLETSDRRFERLTGVTDNVLSVKDLDRG